MKKKLIAVLAGVAVAGIAAVAYKKHKESKEETTSEEVIESSEDVEETIESTEETTEETKTYRFSKIKRFVSKNKGISKVKACLSSIKVAKDSVINRISEKAKKRIVAFVKTFVFSCVISFLAQLLPIEIKFYKRNGMTTFKADWLMGKAKFNGDIETYKKLKDMR